VVPESIMPSYAFLATTPLKVANVTADLTANALAVGVPYSEDMVANAEADLILRRPIPMRIRPGSRSAIRRPSSAISTAIRQWSPRWMRWCPICRCSARWSISREVSGVETTGHVWDGIRELNNPLPRWWLWTFYLSIIWAIGYMIAYPAIPLINGATKGVLGYSSRAEVVSELAEAKAAQGALLEKVAATPVEEIASDPELLRFAIAGGSSAFKVNCAQCHGSGAAGSPGYPNLNDDDWIWGGTIDQIYLTIAHGIRYDGDEDTRVSEMPAFGDILEAEQINQVAAYVVSLSDTPSDPAMVEPGKVVFAENCAACHGENAEGIPDFGAPRLSDGIWLKGSTEAQIVQQIRNPKHGVMPAWVDRLGEPTIKQLAVFVHTLGGGQ
jgi:cytochrome c oxidase cbb3-type subunit 3